MIVVNHAFITLFIINKVNSICIREEWFSSKYNHQTVNPVTQSYKVIDRTIGISRQCVAMAQNVIVKIKWVLKIIRHTAKGVKDDSSMYVYDLYCVVPRVGYCSSHHVRRVGVSTDLLQIAL